MKEFIALSVGLTFVTFIICLLVKNRIKMKEMSLLLGFALVAGLANANYDVLSKLKIGGVELEMINAEIEKSKDEALKEITKQFDAQREETQLLVRDLNAKSDTLADQSNRLDKIIKRAKIVENGLALQLLITDAQSGSRRSFEKLRQLTESLTGDDAVLARRVIKTVEEEFDPVGGFAMYHSQTFAASNSSGESVPLERLSWRVFVEDFADSAADRRKRIFDTLAKKGDISAVPFIIEQLRTESDLRVCSAVIRCLRLLTSEDPSSLDFEYWSEYSPENEHSTVE